MMQHSTKRTLTALLSAALAVSLFAGCGSSAPASSAAPAAPAESKAAESAAPAASDTAWPERAIELVVPLKAGGDTDFHARTYAKYLEKELGQTITIINVDGAGGTVGAEQVKGAKNDGYKALFYHTGNMYVNQMLGATELDAQDFEIAAVGVLDNTPIVVAGKDSGITSAQDLIDKAKANPNGLSIATTISGFSYYTVCKIEKAGGFQLNAVDVGGAAAMIPAVLGNQVELASNSYGVFKQYIENGDVIPLMVASAERNPSFPDVPTVAECGIGEATSERAYFFAFPKGTPEEIVQKLSDAVQKVEENPEYQKEIKEAYMLEPFFVGHDKALTYMEEIKADMLLYKDDLGQ